MNLLEITNLSVRFSALSDDIAALNSISLQLRPGEVLGIVGESGAGKSTLGLAILGLLEPPGRIVSGSIKLKGRELLSLHPTEMGKIRGRSIGAIFQDSYSALDPVLSIGWQIDETISFLLGLSGTEARTRASEMLQQVGLTDPRSIMRAYPHQLSGGMLQRVVVALAFVAAPELIIADEPTSALDGYLRSKILALIRQLAEANGTSVLLITHDLHSIQNIADRVAVFQHGRIVEVGPVRQLFATPRHEFTKKLVAARFSISAEPRKTDNLSAIAALPDNRGRNTGTTAISLANVSLTIMRRRSFYERLVPQQVLKNVSLQIGFAETFGLVGASGSGKSTLARIVAGLTLPDSGSVHIQSKFPPKGPGKGMLQMIFQDTYGSLNPRMRAFDIVAEPFRFLRTDLDEIGLRLQVNNFFDLVGLEQASAYHFPHEFSGGQRQRIAIARALAAEPEILICDEPTSSLDTISQEQILDLLTTLKVQRKLTMLIISHDMAVIEKMADRIGIIENGILLV